MTHLDLTPAERELLTAILKSRLGSLKEQIYHSITSTFTAQLKEEKETLLGLIEKVESPQLSGKSAE